MEKFQLTRRGFLGLAAGLLALPLVGGFALKPRREDAAAVAEEIEKWYQGKISGEELCKIARITGWPVDHEASSPLTMRLSITGKNHCGEKRPVQGLPVTEQQRRSNHRVLQFAHWNQFGRDGVYLPREIYKIPS